MNITIKEKLIERIQQLLEQAEQVKATHKDLPPGFFGFSTLDEDAFCQWKASAENVIIRTTDTNSPHYKNFVERVKDGHIGHVDSGVGILRALKEDLEFGLLEEVKHMVTAEVFTNFLDTAEHLLEHGHKDPAASLAGAVIENGLRKIAEKNGVQIKPGDDIGSLNTKLAEKGVYNRLKQKQIQVWKAIRNSADHGKFDEYKADNVKSMIEDIGKFLSENP